MSNETKKEHNIVAGWLLYYHERAQELEEKREAIMSTLSPGSAMKDNKVQSSAISDPTGRVGSKLAELARDEQWLKLVEDVEKNLPQKRLIFLRLRREYRYNRGPKGWTVLVQKRFSQELAWRTGNNDTWVSSRETLWRWWNDIILFATGMAKGRGLL